MKKQIRQTAGMTHLPTKMKALDYIRRAHALVLEAEILMYKNLPESDKEQIQKASDQAKQAITELRGLALKIQDKE